MKSVSVIRWGLAARAAPLQVLSQRLEQDLSPGQGDVRAFEARQGGSAFGHPGGNEAVNVCDETKSTGSEKNAACSWGMGSHHDLGVSR
jgi:hypothetical protein